MSFSYSLGDDQHSHFWHYELTQTASAKSLTEQKAKGLVPFAIFDTGFFGYKSLFSDFLAPNGDFTNYSTHYSIHGGSVGSLIAHPTYGGTVRGELVVTQSGIDLQDFEKGLKKVRAQSARVLNISLALKSSEHVEIINKYIKEDDLIVVITAGNDADTLGVQSPGYYSRFSGIIVSCIDVHGEIPPFAKHDSATTLFAPCGRNNIPTLNVKHNYRLIQEKREPEDNNNILLTEFQFGMTSAAAPQITAAIINALAINPNLSNIQIKKYLKESATRHVTSQGETLLVLNHLQLVTDVFENSSL